MSKNINSKKAPFERIIDYQRALSIKTFDIKSKVKVISSLLRDISNKKPIGI